MVGDWGTVVTGSHKSSCNPTSLPLRVGGGVGRGEDGQRGGNQILIGAEGECTKDWGILW